MTPFSIVIAGCAAQIHPLFESTRYYCQEYLTEKTPELSVVITPEDLAFEQAESLAEARREGLRPRAFTDPFLERAAIQRKLAQHLLSRSTLLLHGSAVAVDGVGYLFTAKCGTGKSTHTRYWRETFGSRAQMINDDKPFVQITEEEILVWGSPWSGKHGLHTNMAAPLGGICLLTRGSENRIRPADRETLLPMLFRQSQPPADPAAQTRYAHLVQSLADRIPLWQMECTKDPQAARIAYEAMRQIHPHGKGASFF